VQINREKTTLETLKNGFREIKSYVFKGLLVELNKNANKAISELFEQDVKIEYYNEGEEGEISKIKVKMYIDGNQRSIGLLSGGQFRRAQIASDLALGQLMYNRSNKLLNLQIFDEAFKDLSETTVYNILELLQKQTGSIILIEHNSIIKNSINKVYNVELRNGISQWV
jgi:DNA repair exonuclease SbcCD ATPase subunit